jgi:hypothetical protein
MGRQRRFVEKGEPSPVRRPSLAAFKGSYAPTAVNDFIAIRTRTRTKPRRDATRLR